MLWQKIAKVRLMALDLATQTLPEAKIQRKRFVFWQQLS
jgi:hypothetical protein